MSRYWNWSCRLASSGSSIDPEKWCNCSTNIPTPSWIMPSYNETDSISSMLIWTIGRSRVRICHGRSESVDGGHAEQQERWSVEKDFWTEYWLRCRTIRSWLSKRVIVWAMLYYVPITEFNCLQSRKLSTSYGVPFRSSAWVFVRSLTQDMHAHLRSTVSPPVPWFKSHFVEANSSVWRIVLQFKLIMRYITSRHNTSLCITSHCIIWHHNFRINYIYIYIYIYIYYFRTA